MKPIITNHESYKFLGLKTKIRESINERNNYNGIPQLWQKLAPIITLYPERKGQERYVLITGDLPQLKEEVAYYYAMIAVKNFKQIPKDFVTYELPAGRMAKFIHKGRPETIGMTAEKVIFEWLPKSGETLANCLELITFTADYDRTNPDSELEYSVFLL